MNAIILHRDDLPEEETNHEFQGFQHGDTSISFIWVEQASSGGGPRLHRHPYEEVFIVQEGHVTFTVGTETHEAAAGQIVIVPPGVPHKFVNIGPGPLKQIDIHAHPHFITEWLED